jgi:hypothetical protein
MITTTLAVLALAGGIGSGVIPSTPNWQTDYAQAMNRASAEGKPMAVFIGHGPDQLRKLQSDGSISAEAGKLLARSYICVYLDSDAASGKDLVGRFEINEGLIISSPGGNLQAYRHNGAVSGADLTKSLTQFAGAGQPSTTVTAGAPVVRRASPYYTYPSSNFGYPSNGYYPGITCVGRT